MGKTELFHQLPPPAEWFTPQVWSGYEVRDLQDEAIVDLRRKGYFSPGRIFYEIAPVVSRIEYGYEGIFDRLTDPMEQAIIKGAISGFELSSEIATLFRERYIRIRNAVVWSIAEDFRPDTYDWICLIAEAAFHREAEDEGLRFNLEDKPDQRSFERVFTYGAAVTREFAAFAPHIRRV